MSDNILLWLGIWIGFCFGICVSCVFINDKNKTLEKQAISKGYAEYDAELNFKWKENK